MQIATPRLGTGMLPSGGALVAIGATIVIVAAAGFFISQRLNPAAAPVATQTAKVTRGTISAGVNATGAAVSNSTARLVFKGDGRVSDVLVGVGDEVQAGQTLARMETTDLEIGVQQAQTGVLAAQAKLQQIQTGARPEDVLAAQAALQSARLKLDGMQQSRPEDVAAGQAALNAAQAKLAAMLDGGRNEDITSAEAGVDSAMAKLQGLRAGPLEADVVAARSAIDSAQATLVSARAKLSDLRNGPKASEIAAAESAVETAKSNVQSAEAKLQTLTTGADTGEIASAQAAITQAQASIQSAIAKRDADRADSKTTQEQKNANDAAVAAARANLVSAQAKLDDLRKPPEAADLAAARSAVDSARSTLSSANVKLDELRAGPTAADLAAAQSAVDSGEATLRSAQAKLSQLFVGPQESDLAVAEAGLVQAQAALALKQSPFTDADIVAQQQAVEQAQANLAAKLSPATQSDVDQQRQAIRQAEANLALKQTPYLPADILAAEAQVEQARATLAAAQDKLGGTVIVAPFRGMVSAVAMNVGENASGSTSTGTGGTGGAPSITVVDPAQVGVAIQVDESDIARIEVGQPAVVTFDALAGRRFPATVTAIAPAAGNATQGVVSYLVSLGIQNPRGVRPGMTATAEITYAQADDALSVPNRAVTRQGRDRFVAVMTPTGPVPRQVQVGMSNDQLTEITEGLSEGDEVAIPTTTARAAVPGANAGQRPGNATFGGGGPVIVTGGAPRPAGR